MQGRFLVVCYGIIMLFLCLNPAQTASYGTPAPVSAEPMRILDDFEGQTIRGAWWDSDAWRVYDREHNNTVARSGRYSMRVQFRKQDSPWSFFAFHPAQNGNNNDFTGFTEVIFWVYAEDAVGIILKIEDSNRNYSQIELAIPPKKWHKVSIDLYTPHLDVQDISNILFFVAPGVAQTSGTLYIDDLSLASRDLMSGAFPSSLYIPIPTEVAYRGINACTLNWNQASNGGWAGLFEVVVDTNPEFENPTIYWTDRNYLVLDDLFVGVYHYRVRTWTHLPQSWGYWGCSSTWSQSKEFAIVPMQTVKSVESFEGSSVVTAWWDVDGNQVYVRDVSEDLAVDGKYSMHISYRKTSGYEWSYFGADLKIGDLTDLSWLDQLVVWIYRESGQENFEILFRLHDSEGGAWTGKADIPEVGSWHRVVLEIPANSMNLDRLTHISFFIEPGEADVSGSFYLDGIALGSSRTFLAQPSMVTTTLRSTGSYSHSLTWENGRANGAILYQIREATNTEFHQAESYWTTDTRMSFQEHAADTWYYQVRSWSHFPEAGGQASFWSSTASISHRDIPPVIETVRAFFVDDTDSIFPVGAIPRICVYEKHRATDILRGFVSVCSSTGQIITGPMELVASENREYFYAHWDTRGVPSGNYKIVATLVDSAGQEDTSNSWTIRLEDALPGDFTTLLSVVDISIPTPNKSLLPPFTRTYDTRWTHMRGVRPAEKVLGLGWSHNYNALLFEYVDGCIELQWGTGRVDFFAREGASYVNLLHQEELPILIKNSNGSFTVIAANSITYGFAPNGLLSDLCDANGNRTALQYGGHGFLSRIVGPNGEEINLVYYQNRLTSISDANYGKTIFQYDPQGVLVAATNLTGRTIRYDYNDNHYLTQVQEIGLSRIAFGYDATGRVLTIEEAKRTTTITRNPYAAQLSFSCTSGWWSTYTLDAWGNVVGVVTPRGQVTLHRDATGKLLAAVDKRGGAWEFSFSKVGLVSVSDPLGYRVELAWDDRSHKLLAFTNSLGDAFHAAYDAKGNLISLTAPLGMHREFEYDERGNCILRTSSNGQVSQYEYSAANRLVTLYQSECLLRHYIYDISGNISEQTDAIGNRIIYRYDTANRITECLYPDGINAKYGYCPSGSLAWAENPQGKIEFAYDNTGKQISINYENYGSFSYQYDALDNLSSILYPDGSNVRFLTSTQSGIRSVQETTPGGICTLEYDIHGDLTTLAYPNGWRAEYEYDILGRPAELTYYMPNGTVYYSVTYEYDSVGNLTIARSSEDSRTFQYDSLGYLVSFGSSNGDQVEYYYDSSGNRTSVKTNGTAIEYQANDLGQYTQAGDCVFSYDINGNLIEELYSSYSTMYSYGPDNRLEEVMLSSGEIVQYKYDALGRLCCRIDDVGSRKYLYSGGRIAMELDDQGKVIARYIWGPQFRNLLWVEEGNKSYYYLLDGVGNILGVVSSDGANITQYGYGPFGTPERVAETGNTEDTQLAHFSNEERYDAITGLVYNGTSFYKADIRRLVSPQWTATPYCTKNPYAVAQGAIFDTQPVSSNACWEAGVARPPMVPYPPAIQVPLDSWEPILSWGSSVRLQLTPVLTALAEWAIDRPGYHRGVK